MFVLEVNKSKYQDHVGFVTQCQYLQRHPRIRLKMGFLFPYTNRMVCLKLN